MTDTALHSSTSPVTNLDQLRGTQLGGFTHSHLALMCPSTFQSVFGSLILLTHVTSCCSQPLSQAGPEGRGEVGSLAVLSSHSRYIQCACMCAHTHTHTHTHTPPLQLHAHTHAHHLCNYTHTTSAHDSSSPIFS